MSFKTKIKALIGSVTRWFSAVQPIAIDNASLALSDVIDMRTFAGGWLEIPDTMAATALTWYHARTEGGTYVPVYFGGAAVTTTLPGSTACCVEIPAACWDKYFLKALSNSDADTVYVGKKA